MGDERHGVRPIQGRRWLLVALAVLIPAVPVAIAVAIGLGQSGAGANPTVTTTAGFTPVASQSAAQQPSAPGTHANATKTTKTTKPGIPAAPAGPGVLVALVRHPTALRATPGGSSIAHLTTHTQFGSPETLLVVRRVPGWLGVVATEAGNARTSWIAQNAASLSRVTWELKVSLADRRLTILDGGKVIQRYTVAIGQPNAPTPTGRFAVTDRLLTGNPAGPYGCCILALSATTPHAIQGWSGGNRIAIHSTPEASTIGEAVSHGCLRLTLAEGRWLVNHVPLGTPTVISS
jgi:lipoprotein-anchoring transpeptidase ErfK/SrfK